MQVRAARRLYDEREHTVKQIGSIFGISRTSIYRALRGKPGQAKPAGSGGGGGPGTFGVDRWSAGAVATGPGERLVTVLVTLAVPAEAADVGSASPVRRPQGNQCGWPRE